MSGAVVFNLPLGDHVCHLDATKQDAGAPKILEPEHGPGPPLDHAVVLVDDVVQILSLADLYRRFTLGVDGFERSQNGATYVDRHRLGFAILGDPFFEMRPRRSLFPMGPRQKIDRVTGLVDGAIQVFSLAPDLNVSLVDTSALAGGALVAAKRFLQHQHRQQLEGPAMHG